jgi:hypothetical protein
MGVSIELDRAKLVASFTMGVSRSPTSSTSLGSTAFCSDGREWPTQRAPLRSQLSGSLLLSPLRHTSTRRWQCRDSSWTEMPVTCQNELRAEPPKLARGILSRTTSGSGRGRSSLARPRVPLPGVAGPAQHFERSVDATQSLRDEVTAVRSRDGCGGRRNPRQTCPCLATHSTTMVARRFR